MSELKDVLVMNSRIPTWGCSLPSYRYLQKAEKVACSSKTAVSIGQSHQRDTPHDSGLGDCRL
jgi:hypothetical protein